MEKGKEEKRRGEDRRKIAGLSKGVIP